MCVGSCFHSLEVILRKMGECGRERQKHRSASLSAVLQPLGVCECLAVFACAPTAGAPPSGQNYSHGHLESGKTNVRGTRGGQEREREMDKYSGVGGV